MEGDRIGQLSNRFLPPPSMLYVHAMQIETLNMSDIIRLPTALAGLRELMRLGPDVEIVAPVALREEIVAKLSAMSRLYAVSRAP